MTDRDLILETHVRDWLDQCGFTAMRAPLVYWHGKLDSTAGRYSPRNHVIRLNPRLNRYSGEVWRTLLHELAHAVAWKKYKHAGHGLAWKRACRELGIAGESRCHKLPLATPKAVHVYVCPNCGRHFTMKRRNAVNACGPCCQAHNGGNYSAAFRLQHKETRKP